MIEEMYRIKRDGYKSARGRTVLYELFCRKCEERICFYQKDGPGNLRRLYLDRMIKINIVDAKDLHCTNGHLLGVKTVYKKENRPCYRLFVDALAKKRVPASNL